MRRDFDICYLSVMNFVATALAYIEPMCRRKSDSQRIEGVRVLLRRQNEKAEDATNTKPN
jgi:hypothetical protein